MTKSEKLQELLKHKQHIEERIEFLGCLKEEYEQTGVSPIVQLGGIVNDLAIISPAATIKVAVFLLEQYKNSQQTVERLIKLNDVKG